MLIEHGKFYYIKHPDGVRTSTNKVLLLQLHKYPRLNHWKVIDLAAKITYQEIDTTKNPHYLNKQGFSSKYNERNLPLVDRYMLRAALHTLKDYP